MSEIIPVPKPELLIPPQPEQQEPTVLQLDMAALRSKAHKTLVSSVDIIFTGADGVKRLVRTTAQEQDGIANRILANRRTGNKGFMYRNVAVLPMEVALAFDEIVHLAAAGDVQAQAKAKTLLADWAGEGKPKDEPQS